MSIVATMNASLVTAGASGGGMTITVPATTASTALDIRTQVSLPNAYQALASLTGVGTTLTGATGMIIIPTGLGPIWMGAAAVSQTMVCIAPNPAIISGGITGTAGIWATNGNICELIIY